MDWAEGTHPEDVRGRRRSICITHDARSSAKVANDHSENGDDKQTIGEKQQQCGEQVIKADSEMDQAASPESTEVGNGGDEGEKAEYKYHTPTAGVGLQLRTHLVCCSRRDTATQPCTKDMGGMVFDGIVVLALYVLAIYLPCFFALRNENKGKKSMRLSHRPFH